MTGKIYFVDEFNFKNPPLDFIKEFDEVGYDYYSDLCQGIIIQNGQNEKLKFDIDDGKEYHGRYFTGFLYPDGTLLGKFKYVHDANVENSNISGYYKKIDKNRILIRGVEEDTKSKQFFWIELVHNEQ